ncbi:MAG: DUF4082 domain-containing protein [Chitinophagaceae bacterium]
MKAVFFSKELSNHFVRGYVKLTILSSFLLLSLIKPVNLFSQTTPLTFTAIPFIDPDIISPGRGAEQWHDGNGSINYPLQDMPQQSLDAYYRFTWNRLEGSSQGSYDWNYFDGLVKEVINKGQKLSFGIMTCYPDEDSNPGMVIYDNGNSAYPEYLHQLMQSESDKDWKTTGSGPTDGYGSWVPNWNSKYYLDRLRALHEALYAHIKSSTYTATAGPNKGKTIPYKDAIFSIDIRGYGSWGEWHSAGIVNLMTSYPAGRRPTAATLKTIIDHHVNVFTDHPLSIMISAFDAERLPNTDNPKEVAAYALGKTNNWGKLGWRRDNWGATDDYLDGYLKGNTLSFGTSGPFNAIINERWKSAPVTGEPPSWVASLNGCGYDDLERQVREYHATSVGNGNYGSISLADCAKDNIKNAFKAAGYRIILESGNISNTIRRGSAFTILLNWKNIGIAPTYEKWNVVFELKDANNNNAWSGTSQFSPGPKIAGSALLPSSAATPAIDNLTLPANIQPGNYKLNLIIKDPTGYRAPLPLAITGRNPDGSYTLKNIVVDSGTTIPPVTPPTIPSTNATLIGTIGLQGRPAAPDSKWQVPLKVDLYIDSSSSTLVRTYNVTTDSIGQFIIDSITPRKYYIVVKNSHTLKRNVSDSLVTGDNRIFFGILPEGDINNDNIVSSVDSVLLMNSFLKGAGDSLFDSRADLNEDGVVNALDSSLLAANYHNQESPSGNCGLISATISNTAGCDGQPFDLVLSSATGISPFDVVINGKTYNDIPVGGIITTVAAAATAEKIWSADPVAKTYEDSPVELGVKFSSTVSGFVKGVRFFSANNVSGEYTGHLWTADGTLLASAVFSNVTADGWQEVLFSEPVKVDAGITYVASYYNSSGIYAATAQGLNEAVSNGNSLTTLTNDSKGTSGVYTYNGPGFPSETHNATNYWVDVVFTTGPYEFKLTGITDSIGCSSTGDLQTLTVTSTPCSQQRSALSTQSVQQPVVIESKSQPEVSFNYGLHQNYPNPFTNETTIVFSLAKSSKVSLTLFDMNGRLMKVLVNGSKEAGTHTIRFNAGTLSKGLYLYKLQTGDYSAVRRMIIQ